MEATGNSTQWTRLVAVSRGTHWWEPPNSGLHPIRLQERETMQICTPVGLPFLLFEPKAACEVYRASFHTRLKVWSRGPHMPQLYRASSGRLKSHW